MSLPLIRPDWPAPARVQACVTTRLGGVSAAPFGAFNPAGHVGDDPAAVAQNRTLLRAALPAEPVWLDQVHGCDVIDADAAAGGTADASLARRPGRVCAVLTADCLPVLMCDAQGATVAAVHAGWRGLAGGVLENAVARMGCEPCGVMAWLGPAIGPAAFEVGPEVRAAFTARLPDAGAAFHPGRGDRLHADIYLLARLALAGAGVTEVFGGGLCTVTQAGLFHSFRRDGRCGRMASLIWLRE
ncbi:MAG: peptidoglycan editing factor PgeF [Gammaproteobacteria bacterium]|jgi:polyphenol oxidase|nr:peptidoglycan editing factor PgeF [Gammaproteobacteria bacterium]MBU0769836.1 peptidoglycan editing factor PgeF [Gammaproteobacteria bacterium]MBU0856449.1 peptidoglycan editing factor PgeF [Gammaproteobacteria bacterium]MBU1847490.1 peptidoglycan editing factor PgeF [Gammaproteobacteria bacterium]